MIFRRKANKSKLGLRQDDLVRLQEATLQANRTIADFRRGASAVSGVVVSGAQESLARNLGEALSSGVLVRSEALASKSTFRTVEGSVHLARRGRYVRLGVGGPWVVDWGGVS